MYQQKEKTMATKKFDMREYLHTRRDEVIAKYTQLTQDPFFDGITLKAFMLEFMYRMQLNCKSEKRAISEFPWILSSTFCDHKRIEVINDLDARRASNAPNGQWMAIL